MGQLLWEVGHWIFVVTVVGFGLLVFIGVIIHEHERHLEQHGIERKPPPTWQEIRELQFYRADGTNMAKGRPTLSETQSAESDDVDGLERWRDLLNDSGLHDSDSGFDDDLVGWN